MFDTMTMTKALGGFCIALLALLLGGWAADGLYNIDVYHGDDHVRGYVIAVDEGDDAAPAEDVVEIAFADVYATADASAGEGLWRSCRSCHALEPGANGVGPYLHGIVDRPMHSAEGFSYSDGLLAISGTWTPEELSAFLESPSTYAPGTAMNYRGMSDIEDRANLIAYLATFQ